MDNKPTQEQQKPVNPSPDSGGGSFFSRHGKMITRLIIITIIIVGAAIYSQTQNPKTNNQQNDQESEATLEVEKNDANLVSEENSEDGASVKVEDSTSESPEISVTEETPGTTIKVSGKEIIVVAQSGNGYTHLARRALAEYLDTTGNQGLKIEHKIFAEDYLQKKITDRQSLHSGDEVNFAQDQIQESIDAALQLTDAQVNNLSQYVPLVPSLN